MEKDNFINTIIDNDKFMPKGISECEKYGMFSGCDKFCPVFQRGKCELQKENQERFSSLEDII